MTTTQLRKLAGITAMLMMAVAPLKALANPYTKTYNQFMGYASTGEPVTLLQVKTLFRGGVGSWVTYRIGGETVETGFECHSYSSDPRPYFTDQGTRYAQSAATRKILSIACAYEKAISSEYGHLYDTAP